MKVYIETERLILRDLRAEDIDGIFELDSNPLVHKYLGNNPINSKNQAKEIIKFVQLQYKERGIGRFAAIKKSSGEFIGWSGLKLNSDKKEALNGKQNFYDIGYRLIPKFWGKGYATESSIKMLQYGFDNLKLDTIVGAAEVANIASNKILKKIGLQFINEFKYDNIPCNWYELNKEDYGKKMS
ncbi:MAG: GNAT family N-acetyltransferase [Bacteroidia bacterium]|nr:GNAT family N-acetyltransferase [Bacteroidia bacterium]